MSRYEPPYFFLMSFVRARSIATVTDGASVVVVETLLGVGDAVSLPAGGDTISVIRSSSSSMEVTDAESLARLTLGLV
jgi:hypothetical protein